MNFNLNKKKNRGGFTIVELVVVIAVIAILSAVLIPSFAGLIKKANQSADIQAVRQMNTVLSSYADEKITSVSDAVKVLNNENINLDNYQALQKDHYFYFVLDNNGTPTIIYTDKDNNIIYPESVSISNEAQWMSLSGVVPMDSNYSVTDGKVSLDSGAKLVDLMEKVKSGKTEVSEISLTGKVDLKGAAVDFGKTKKDIKIVGTEGTTISGVRADNYSVSPSSGVYAGHTYGFGLFGNIESGNVTIENITISNLVVGNSIGDHSGANTVGLIAGYIDRNASVTLKNVTFKDCVVNGYQKVGGIVGQLHGSLEMENVNFENTVVNGYIEVAKVAGIVSNCQYIKNESGVIVGAKANEKLNLKIKNCNFDGITVNNLNSLQVAYSQLTENVKGSNTNTYSLYTVNYPNIWAGSTNDLYWYDYFACRSKDDENKFTDERLKISINGHEYTAVAYFYSSSTNITSGTIGE